jgi:hypothetical protein
MPRSFVIKTLKGINWDSHDNFEDFIRSSCVQVGDTVKVENHLECPLPLDADEFCLTFDNEKLFVEELFTLDECVLLFGDDFASYVSNPTLTTKRSS